jgi:hypothetical protein
VAANWFLIPLSILVILGGCWRFLCLRSLRSAGVESGWLSLWRRFTAAWCLGGLVAVGLIFATGALGLPESIGSQAFAAWGIWRFLPIVEVLLATIWVAREAAARESAWASVVVTAGFAGCLVAMALQALWLAPQNLTPMLSVLLGAVVIAAGFVGPLLIADAISRLLQSMSSESLDEASEPPDVSRSR